MHVHDTKAILLEFGSIVAVNNVVPNFFKEKFKKRITLQNVVHHFILFLFISYVF